jgi:hypothetical protein
MAALSFDDPVLQTAMRAYLEACKALDTATDDADVLLHSDAKSMAGMSLRKRLVELGWTAPSRQRSSK